MTFKHTKFEDSSTMRSLVKVAQDKGWIKEGPLSKQASTIKTADLKSTTNLMENVIKLCNGLRERGFTKYADELETNLFTYKQAQTLYEVNKEKGDDLLGEAHPQGSHKLEDVDSNEAVFEDLIDKHKKIVQVVEKKPSGKLVSASEILGAVKRVLADWPPVPNGGGLNVPELNFPAPEVAKDVTQASRAARLLNLLRGGTAGLGEGVGVGSAAGAAWIAGGLAVALGANWAGWTLFDRFYKATDFATAGEKVNKEHEDVRSDWKPEENAVADKFAALLKQTMAVYPVIEKIQTNRTPETIAQNAVQLEKLSLLVNELRKYAGAIWSYADSKLTQVNLPFVGRGPVNFLGGESDVVAVTGNFMKVCGDTATLIDSFFNESTKALEKIRSQQPKSSVPKLSSPVQNLIVKLKEVIQKYISNVNYFNPTSKVEQINYLNGVLSYLTSQEQKFSSIPNITEEIENSFMSKVQETEQSLMNYGKDKPWTKK